MSSAKFGVRRSPSTGRLLVEVENTTSHRRVHAPATAARAERLVRELVTALDEGTVEVDGPRKYRITIEEIA